MFDRFADRSKRVMSLARKAAMEWNHDYIGTEHVLVGMLREGGGVAVHVLREIGLDVEHVARELEARVDRGLDPVTLRQLPFTMHAKHVLEYALEEASALGHSYIGTAHLLSGLVRERDGLAGRVLRELGCDAEVVREHVVALLGEHDGAAVERGGELTVELTAERPPRAPADDIPAAATELARRVLAVLGELPRDQKSALWLRHGEQHGWDEIARRTGCADIAGARALIEQATEELARRLFETGP